jgi:hypothetical protein
MHDGGMTFTNPGNAADAYDKNRVNGKVSYTYNKRPGAPQSARISAEVVWMQLKVTKYIEDPRLGKPQLLCQFP